jgi:hypothetical protein
VQGSAEALADAVTAVKTENASVNVLRAGKKRVAQEDGSADGVAIVVTRLVLLLPYF